MKTTPTHGGTRPGSGRPKGEPTTTISFRVKTRFAERIKKIIFSEIKKLLEL